MKRLSNRNDATVQTDTASEAFINVQRRGLSAEMIMSNKNNGGPAFAASGHPEKQFIQQEGMTLRDYMAAKAMQGWLASFPESYQHPVSSGKADLVAEVSYLMADAMLRAREAS